MSNGRLAVGWALDGTLTSVIDVARGRELIPAGGAGAELLLAPDRPVQYDAWDVESWTVAGGVPVGAPESIDVEAAGPLVGIVAVRRSFGPSTAVVRYVLRAESPRLDVEIELDWHHDEHLLSMRFPLDVHADTAACGVQFGSVRRPTHASTTWDAAKFEVCAHRYVDLAEPDFGVAVLDNGRYGHGIFDPGLGGAQSHSVRVSLARAAKYPDPDADHGRHAVTLALLPHGPGLADVVAEAERLELPLRIVDVLRATATPWRLRGCRHRWSASRGGASRSTPSRSPTTAVATSSCACTRRRGTGWQRRSPSPDASPPPPAATYSSSRSVTSRCPTASAPSRCARSS